jgi:O-antigen/teichoic acid export membrane protein
METSFFRFASKSENPGRVYSTALISVFSTSVLFLLIFALLKNPFASWIQFPQHPEYVVWFAVILAIDAVTAIPFAWIRIEKNALKFAVIKLVNIAFNIGFNLFFLTFCPWFLKHNPESWIKIFYSPEIGVGYIFISNLLASVIMLLMLLPDILKIHFQFDKEIFKKLLNYGFPILLVGIAGQLTLYVSNILIPFLIPESQEPLKQLGIYGANLKLAVLMNMFIQAFRFAFEPFFFARGNSKDDPLIYANIMKYFVIFGLMIFLGMTLFVDLLQYVNDEKYNSGLKVLPIILMANLVYGMYYTQSLWYKITDKTRYGAIQSVIASVVSIVLNFMLIPVFGYMGSAVTLLFSYILVLIISYFQGEKYYPVPYNLKRIGIYFSVALSLFFISWLFYSFNTIVKTGLGAILIFVFCGSVYAFEKNDLKGLFKTNKKK